MALGLVGIDRSRVGGTELTAQWYVTPSGDKLISYYGPEEECELYGSWATVNQTMETIRGERMVFLSCIPRIVSLFVK